MQQQSHSTPSPHGQETHGFVDPLIGFEMVDAMDEDVEEGGMIIGDRQIYVIVNLRMACFPKWILTDKKGNVAAKYIPASSVCFTHI
jgi:hypothetical protein